MRTRSRAPAGKGAQAQTEATATAAAASTTKSIAPSVDNPPKLFILPKDASPEACIVTIANPATTTPSRYYFCPDKGFYEFTKVAAPKKTPRSWLLASHRRTVDGASNYMEDNVRNGPKERIEPAADGQKLEESSINSEGYITKDADLFVATPMDCLFVFLPALAPETAKGGQKQLFLAFDDHLDALGSSSFQMKQLLRNSKLRARIQKRMSDVCDSVDAGDELMFRLSSEKLLKELLAKAQRMATNGLPKSMEDKFVHNTLEVPIMNVKREASTLSAASVEIAEDESQSQSTDIQPPSENTADSQQSTDSALTTSTKATSVSETPMDKDASGPLVAPEGVPQLLRIRTALDFMMGSYLPANLRSQMHTALQNTDLVDFAPLDAHIKHLASLRSSVQALRSLSDNISRKRSAMDDDEAAEARAEKKRKKEEEEKKKKMESRGVRDLKKADISGMKKLSAFFSKAPAKKK